jgi:hypothetical protein
MSLLSHELITKSSGVIKIAHFPDLTWFAADDRSPMVAKRCG